MRPLPRLPSRTAIRRIEALSVLPVFFDLKGRRAVLIGGSVAASWKAELLAAAGAHVDIYAERPGGEMLNLASNGGLAGSVRLIPMRWSADAFAGAAVIVADAATRAEAVEIYTAASTAGIPLNVIDQPEFCGFQFGAIVNRSPLVIGISTSGSVPVLAQEIRSRIESILPLKLARWARIAGRLRRVVSRRIATARERRRFWENFVARAMSSKSHGGAPERMTVITAPTPEDLTLREIRALQAADVIHVGDCYPAGILDFARREARRINLAGYEANSEGVGNVVIIRG